ncbi:MAG: FprA family A-type flavoprotein [Sedimentisphaerales bacterium]|nr:FprA family A-type flavoprotein [Sedimentisphaerales bacterium]
MKSVAITKNKDSANPNELGIHWVGHVDWTIRDFHGYQTHRGSTYNAYLIVDDKVALIDAVKAGYGDDMFEKISEHVDPSKIDYIISNHTEPDHSGEIARVLELAPQAEVVASEKGRQGLTRYYPGDWKFRTVKTGDTLTLGKTTLKFICTPMLHWPDSMFTYLPDSNILFSMDAFGQHYATSARYDDDVEFPELMFEAKTYYANILMHLGSITAKTLKQAGELDIDMICPSHGVIWRKHIPDIIQAYQDWSIFKPKPKVLVIYDSMWHSTEIMAETIAQAAAEENVEVKLLRLGVNDLTILVTEVLDAAALAIGTPTLNNTMMPAMGAFLTYLQGLKPRNKSAFVFGSHGWSGGGVEAAAEILKNLGLELVGENIRCQYLPDEETLKTCRAHAKKLAGIAKTAGV